MKHGTAWTGPGEGATWSDIGSALHFYPLTYDSWGRWALVIPQPGLYDDRRTNLRLTGEPLNEYDIRRIAEAR